MKPLDGLIATSINKPTDSTINTWAFNMINKQKIKLGIREKINDFEEVIVVGENSGSDADKYWKIEKMGDGKYRIYVPEARPKKLVGSMWEEVKIDDVPLINYIRSGQDIPWDAPGTQSPWGDYATRLDKANKLLGYFQGKNIINLGSEGRDTKWTSEVTAAIADMGMTENDKMKRWIVYSSKGIRPQEQRPKINDRALIRHLLAGITYYMPQNKLFFPWDGESILTSWT
jgi:hypothetical protein